MAQRELVDPATRKTKAARRGNAAGSKSKGDRNDWGSLRGVDSREPVPFVEDTD
jgi:putative transposase